MLYIFALIGFLSVHGVKLSKKNEVQTRVMLQPEQSISCSATVSGSTVGATDVYGKSAGDVDYSFLLPFRGVVTVNSCGSTLDTFIRIFDESGTTQLCACDDCGSCGLQTILDCELEAGNYIIVVDGFSNNEGDYSIEVTCPEPLIGTVECGGTETGSTVGLPNWFGNDAGDSMYSFELLADTTVTVDSCESGFDTWLRVLNEDRQEVCGCDDCGPCGYLTVLDCDLSAGEYIIVVDGYYSDEGDFSISISCTAHAMPIGCGEAVTGTTVGFSDTYGNPAADIPYSLSLTEDSSITLSSCNSGFDTWLRVFNADGSAEVCGCDDCGDCDRQTVLECDLRAGEYLVVVDGWASEEGDFNLEVSCQEYQAIGCNDTAVGSTVGVANVIGNTAGDSLHPFSLGADSFVTIDSCGSDFDTYIRVWDSTLSTEVCSCDDCGSCGLQTVLDCDLVAGDYIIVVDGYSDSEGDFELSVSCI